MVPVLFQYNGRAIGMILAKAPLTFKPRQNLFPLVGQLQHIQKLWRHGHVKQKTPLRIICCSSKQTKVRFGQICIWSTSAAIFFAIWFYRSDHTVEHGGVQYNLFRCIKWREVTPYSHFYYVQAGETLIRKTILWKQLTPLENKLT
jgi:hypothetical protein